MADVINIRFDGDGNAQVTVMPAASQSLAGKFVQYIGATNGTYTHGYFYECTLSGESYVWTRRNVQPSGGSGTTWGDLDGSIQNQTDLNGQLEIAAAAITNHDKRLAGVEDLLSDGNTAALIKAVESNRHLRAMLYEAMNKKGGGDPITPGILPDFIGQEYLDTTNKKMYKAFGLAAADWTLIN